MQIPSVNQSQPAAPTTRTSPTTAVRSKETASPDTASNASETDAFSASAYEPIQQAMNQLPDTRSEVVARGKALAANPNYPSLVIINKLARTFVADAESGGEDEG